MKATTIQDLASYIRAGQSMMYVNSVEERRAIRAICRTGWLVGGGSLTTSEDAELREAVGIAVPETSLPEVPTAAAVLDIYDRALALLDKTEDTKRHKELENAIATLTRSLNRLSYETREWEQVRGFSPAEGEPFAGELAEAIMSLPAQANKQRVIFVIKDAHMHLGSRETPLYRRAVRNMFESGELVAGENDVRVVFLQPYMAPHADIRHCLVKLEFPLPSEQDIEHLIDDVEAGLPKGAERCGEGLRIDVRRSLLGLDAAAVEKSLALTVVQFGGFKTSRIFTESGDPVVRSFASRLREMRSRQLSAARGMKILDPEHPAIESLGELGGYGNVRKLADDVKFCDTPTAAKLKIRPPSGFAIIGPPGCGKTVCAKLFAKWIGWPFVQVNMGTTKGGIVGESEENMEANLATIRALGRCVVLFDEWDKQAAGITGGDAGDGNTSASMLSLVLDFASDPTRKAFLIFTMNRLDGPIESLRAGRVSRVYYTPLPKKEARLEILKLKLAEAGAEIPAGLEEIADDSLTGKFSGAELGELVDKAIIHAAKTTGRKDPTVQQLRAARGSITPVSKLDGAAIAAMENFAQVAISVDDSDNPESEPLRSSRRRIQQ